MKQFPNNLKFKKYHKANNFFFKKIEKKIFFPFDGEYALQCLEAGKLKFKQIEACRRTIKRGLTKQDNLWIKIFTNIPITKKPSSSRMGKGKGNLAFWIANIKKGTVLFEISGLNMKKAEYVLEKSKTKLPVRTKITKNIY